MSTIERPRGNRTAFIQVIREEDPSNMGLGEVGSEAESPMTLEELHKYYEQRRLDSEAAAIRAVVNGAIHRRNTTEKEASSKA